VAAKEDEKLDTLIELAYEMRSITKPTLQEFMLFFHRLCQGEAEGGVPGTEEKMTGFVRHEGLQLVEVPRRGCHG
jgi:hypothetical protein